jgi:hypothetical protein
MAMPENGDKDSADRVEVPLSLSVPAVESFGPLDDQWIVEESFRGTVIDKSAAK